MKRFCWICFWLSIAAYSVCGTWIFLLPSSSSSAAYAKEWSPPWKSIVQIRSSTHEKSTRSLGSAAIIEDGYVLSCGHVIHDAKPEVLVDGKWVVCEIIAMQLKYDWSLLRLPDEFKRKGLSVSSKRPVGERVYAYGYGGGSFGFSRLRCDDLAFRGSGIVHGDSGGPILNSKGRVVSVICAVAPSLGTVSGYDTARLAQFVQRAKKHDGEGIALYLDW